MSDKYLFLQCSEYKLTICESIHVYPIAQNKAKRRDKKYL